MQKLILISKVKIYNKFDFKLWLDWYSKFIKFDRLYLVNDNSLLNIEDIIADYSNIHILDVTGKIFWLNLQCGVYNYILGEYVDLDDIVIFPDDDEFWWYDYNRYDSFKDACIGLLGEFNTKVLTVSWQMMSNNVILESRLPDTNFNDNFKYTISNLKVGYRKPIIWYNKQVIRNIHNDIMPGIIHYLPIMDKKYSILASIDFNCPIKLFHYQITTREEYDIKMSNDINPSMNMKGYKRIYYKKEPKDFIKALYKGDYWFDTLDLTVDETVRKFI